MNKKLQVPPEYLVNGYGSPAKPKEKTFLVVVDDSATRDIQIARAFTDEGECPDDDWFDMNDAEVVVGTYEAMTEKEALGDAANYMDMDVELLKAYRLK